MFITSLIPRSFSKIFKREFSVSPRNYRKSRFRKTVGIYSPCMPIFIDENGAVAALQDAGVPVLMQAYPDEIGKMDFKHRRDDGVEVEAELGTLPQRESGGNLLFLNA